MAMKWQEVKSSQVAKVGYDEEAKMLGLEFTPKENQTKGAIYHYENFSADDMSRFKTAKSIGTHFHQWIRGRFKHTKIADAVRKPQPETQEEK